MTSRDNYFRYFNYGEFGGVFFIDQATFTDEESTFLQNSAVNGGALYCQFCTMTLKKGEYEKNYA